MSRSTEKATRRAEAKATQAAIKRLWRLRKRIWLAFASVLLLAPLVYWIGHRSVWLLYLASCMMLLGLDLLAGQRVSAHQKRRVEAAVVAAMLPLVLYSILAMLYAAVRMAGSP